MGQYLRIKHQTASFPKALKEFSGPHQHNMFLTIAVHIHTSKFLFVNSDKNVILL